MKKKKNNSKKKAKKPEEKKEEDLEKEIEKLEKEIDKRKAEELEFGEFDEFLEEPEFQRDSPSLGKINVSPANVTRLETNLAESTIMPNSEEEKDSFKYNFGGDKKDEPKYVNYEKGITPEFIPRTEIENLGKNLFERREVGFRESPQARLEEERNFEKYNPATKIDKEQLGKERDERREIKYKPLN